MSRRHPAVEVERTDRDDADTTMACTRKKAYPTMAIAKAVARGVNARDEGARCVAYACRRCGYHHIGADENLRVWFIASIDER